MLFARCLSHSTCSVTWQVSLHIFLSNNIYSNFILWILGLSNPTTLSYCHSASNWEAQSLTAKSRLLEILQMGRVCSSSSRPHPESWAPKTSIFPSRRYLCVIWLLHKFPGLHSSFCCKTNFPLRSTHFLKRFYFFLERREGREKERGRNTNVKEKHSLSYVPSLGTEPAAEACALTENGTSDLSLCGTTPNQLSLTGQGEIHLFC